MEKIAVRINKEREQFAWFLDRPESDEELEATVEELLELLQVDGQLVGDLRQEIGMRQVPENCLITPARFEELVVCERSALSLHKAAEKTRRFPGYEVLRSIDSETRARMLGLLKNLVGSMDELARHVYVWVERAAREIAAGQDHVWRHLLKTTEECLRELSERSREFSTMQVVGLEGRNHSDVAVHARDLKAHLGSGKGLGFVGPFRTKVVKEARYLIKTVRIEGELCRSVDTLQKLLDWLNYERRLGELADLWRMYTSPPEGDYAVRIAAYKDLYEPLRDAWCIGQYGSSVERACFTA